MKSETCSTFELVTIWVIIICIALHISSNLPHSIWIQAIYTEQHTGYWYDYITIRHELKELNALTIGATCVDCIIIKKLLGMSFETF